MKSFKADYVFPIYADPIKNGIVTIDDTGKILSITDDPSTLAPGTIQELSGIICPGFINTHCHLELSFYKDKIAQGGGLVNFIKDLLTLRKAGVATDDEMAEAAANADQEMYDNGIVAVGDIINTAITKKVKQQSKLYYHTFVEALGFLPEKATEVFETALELVEQFKPMQVSLTPHAPYTVSKELFKLIKKHSDTGKNLISIHNQECEDENKFYRYKLGGFNDLYEHLGLNIDYFKPQARNSLQSIIPLLTNNQEVLLVHNTCTNLKDIYFIKRFDRRIHWCFCPNANIFIENRLPKINLFIDQGFNITLGTDSLASNNKLCILSEMRVLQKKFPSIGIETLLKWATQNGAEYLGISDTKGTLEPGKNPGLNLISGLDDLRITAESTVTRLD
ncbi:amidohydrolase [Mucilaginibacter hurinus]|uniref:Amidohydrolase n=1 Tax=Mucilaginibacter hurinus TaxID=2201324 RepID=A0A367GPQ9_9SPHI|nr:amidohydrolase family protein [Mucilaginibacter hurinus]RCH54651.1 amidohydrolase [Mucilaginibacter hurinus]